jgi:hypothetical protein
MSAFDHAFWRGQFEVRLPNHIWRAGADLLGGEHTIFDEAHNSHPTDAQLPRCFLQNYFSTLRAFTFPVNRNVMVATKCSHALLRPGMILCGPNTKPIQNRGDLVIGQQASEITQQLLGSGVRLPTMLPCSVLHHVKRRVITTLPMQFEPQLTRLHSDNDLLKHRTQNSLSYCRRSSWMVPQARQVCCQRQEFGALGRGHGRRPLIARAAKLVFKARDFREPFIPPSFEIADNQAIIWIDRNILSVGAIRFVARLLQRQLDFPQAHRTGALTIGNCLQGSIEPKRRNQRQHLG